MTVVGSVVGTVVGSVVGTVVVTVVGTVHNTVDNSIFETTWKIEKLSAPNGLSAFFRLESNGVIGVAGIRIGQNQ